MKRSERVKSAWRGRPNISLKAWARQHIAKGGDLAEVCAEWLKAKGAALSQVEG